MSETSPITSTDEVIAKLTNGTLLHKIKNSKKFYRRRYQIDINNMQISYGPSQKRYFCLNIPNVDLENISEVRTGWKSDTFNKIETKFNRKKLRNIKEDNCFSLVFTNKTETIDLVASNSYTRDLWVKGIDYLIALNKTQKKEYEDEYFLKKQFREADRNGNGNLNLDEVLSLLNILNVCLDIKHVKVLFNSANYKKNKSKSEEFLDEDEFYELYKMLTKRPKMDEIFKSYTYNKTSIMCEEHLSNFLKTEQKMSEITLSECQSIIEHFDSQNNYYFSYLTNEGFQKMLLSSNFDIFDIRHQIVCQDMSQPLSHYYIASSHNTYLFNGQLYGNSSIEGYRIALMKGCRCLELDVWDGESEPVVYHGHTLTKKITFRDIIELIEEYAFRTSEFPVILSLENHCNLQQQTHMASILVAVLGDFLVQTPLSKDETLWPSPEELRRKIIVKGKKLPPFESINTQNSLYPCILENKQSDDDLLPKNLRDLSIKHNIAIELSNVISYCVSKKFVSFDDCIKKWKFYEMSSFAETEAQHLIQNKNKEFIEYNRKHLSRIYPKGLRTDSSNYDPIPHWNVGSQLVALNYQTHSKPMLFNDALFSLNGKCGYVLKAQYLRNDSLYENQSKRVVLSIISGQHIPKPNQSKEGEVVDPYVKVKVYGHACDKYTFKTNFVKNNGFNPIWDEKCEFLLKFAELSFIYFVVKDHCVTGKDHKLAQYVLPFEAITQGYRNIELNDEHNQPITYAKLFVKIELSNN